MLEEVYRVSRLSGLLHSIERIRSLLQPTEQNSITVHTISPDASAGAEIIRRRRTAVHSRLTIRDILFPNDADCA